MSDCWEYPEYPGRCGAHNKPLRDCEEEGDMKPVCTVCGCDKRMLCTRCAAGRCALCKGRA